MPDERIRYLSPKLGLRAVTVVTTESVAVARKVHATAPTATAALGRVITGAALLGSTLKDEQTVTLRVNGGGPAGTLIGTCDSKGFVRGYIANPAADLPPTSDKKLDVAGVVGTDGYISVSYDLALKEPYVGTAQLVNGEIAMDLAYYLTTSEQLGSSVGLGVLVGRDGHVKSAGGFLLQVLPGPELEPEIQREREGAIDLMIERSNQIESVSHRLNEGISADDLAGELVDGLPFKYLGADPIEFRCTCDRERVASLLASMGEEEIEKVFEDSDTAEVTCQFCRQSYRFTEDEIARLRQAKDGEDDDIE
ncbi:MAG: Hsp33 family molecular chaperone HslO [Clostridia bacterium]